VKTDDERQIDIDETSSSNCPECTFYLVLSLWRSPHLRWRKMMSNRTSGDKKMRNCRRSPSGHLIATFTMTCWWPLSMSSQLTSCQILQRSLSTRENMRRYHWPRCDDRAVIAWKIGPSPKPLSLAVYLSSKGHCSEKLFTSDVGWPWQRGRSAENLQNHIVQWLLTYLTQWHCNLWQNMVCVLHSHTFSVQQMALLNGEKVVSTWYKREKDGNICHKSIHRYRSFQ